MTLDRKRGMVLVKACFALINSLCCGSDYGYCGSWQLLLWACFLSHPRGSTIIPLSSYIFSPYLSLDSLMCISPTGYIGASLSPQLYSELLLKNITSRFYKDNSHSLQQISQLRNSPLSLPASIASECWFALVVRYSNFI